MKAFEQLLAFSMNDGQAQAEASFPVPSGKQLVIEFVTAILTVPAGQKAAVTFFAQTGSTPPPGIRHALVVVPQGTFNGGDVYSASHLVRVYPTHSTNMLFEFSRNAVSGPASGNVSVTGQFV